jgi:hypothetical protein
MKPLFSDDERAQANRNFIIAHYHHKTNISDFWILEDYLEKGMIKPLYELQKSGRGDPIYGDNTYGYKTIKGYASVYSPSDAETYFKWLISIVSGAKPASEQIINEANNQLFDILHIMESKISIDKSVQLIPPYDWQKLFRDFGKRLDEVQMAIDRSDTAIIEVLKPLLQYVKENKALLDTFCRDSQELLGRGKPHEQ